MKPPRLARALLGALLPGRLRPFVLDDLQEELERRAQHEGPAAARRWYRRQVRAGLLPAARLRWRGVAALLAGGEGRVLRRLRRSPGFAAVVVATLALGFAANITIFSFVDTVLLRPLPYPEPDRLVVVKHAMPIFDVDDALQSTGTYFHYREQATSFVDMGIYHTAAVNLSGDGEPRRISLHMATPSLFATLGVSPLLGRLFTDHDVRPGGEPVVMLTHSMWRDRFGADPDVVGAEVVINNSARRVVGVLPPEFDFPAHEAVIWMSNSDIQPQSARFGDLFFGNVARLRRGVSHAEAEAELRSLVPSLAEAYDDVTAEVLASSGFSVRLVDLREEIVGDVDESLWMLTVAVAMVLLIAAANVANLLLVRAEYQRREIAVRRALGAGRGHLLAYLLAESAVLCLLAGALAVVLTRVALELVPALLPAAMPRAHAIGLDLRTLAFSGALSLVAALALTATASLRHRLTAPQEALRDGLPGGTGNTAAQRAGRVLVASQAAVAVALLIGALLLVQSFAALRAVDLGFRAEGVLAVDLALPYRDYPEYEDAARFYRQLRERVEALPDVASASAVGSLPLAPPQFPPTMQALHVEGRVLGPGDIPPSGRMEFFLPGYFGTMGVPIVYGAAPEGPRAMGAELPVVLNESFARRLFGTPAAVGRRLRTVDAAGDFGPWWTVVAVAADVPYDGVTAPPAAIVYLPVLDRPVHPRLRPRVLTLVARGPSSAAALTGAVRTILRDLDPGIPIAGVRTGEAVVAAAMAETTFSMLLLAIAAVAAVFLGNVGLYGVVSFAVGQRRREIGVRMALGARSADIRKMVLRQGALVLLCGLALGLVLALATTRLAAGLLYGVDPFDPWTFVAAPMGLLAIGMVASWLPARRAARTDPQQALRGGLA